MCSRPRDFVLPDERIVAVPCRKCNQCLAVRRHLWTARAMMEKASHRFAFSITLTYNNDTQHARDAAMFFNYAHVHSFLERLRLAVKRAGGFGVRFLACGEQGSQNGRCHWHLIIFTDIDLCSIGVFHGLQGGSLVEAVSPSDILSAGGTVRRLHWSMWVDPDANPFGYVTIQVADRKAMAYVLKYVLKDQFTIENSAGTMREASAERYATGVFRMSKTPPIGSLFFWRRFQMFIDTYSLPPDMTIRVPDMSGYLVLSGGMRKRYIWALYSLAKWIRWQTGSDASQYFTLFLSLSDFEKDILDGSYIKTESDARGHFVSDKFNKYRDSIPDFIDQSQFDWLPY
jgi:hypothetical protein